MNDFTKEELKTILYCVDETTQREFTDEQVIIEKIQAMIDNFCEHDCQLTTGKIQMIISEKQIMQLIRIAEMAHKKFIDADWWHEADITKDIDKLLTDIQEQQSEELRVIK